MRLQPLSHLRSPNVLVMIEFESDVFYHRPTQELTILRPSREIIRIYLNAESVAQARDKS